MKRIALFRQSRRDAIYRVFFKPLEHHQEDAINRVSTMTKGMLHIFLIFCLFLICIPKLVGADLNLNLDDVQKKALEYSHIYKSADFDFNAAQDKVNVVKSQILPMVKLDGGYSYVTEVPKMNSKPLSDNHIYSVGPTISYLLFDSGYAKNDIKSAEAIAASKKLERDAVKNELILKTRMAYIDAQLYFEQLRLVADSLKLAEKQYKDISKRAAIGSTSTQDVLASHKEVLRFSLQCRQMQDTLTSKIIDILALTGEDNKFDLNTAGAQLESAIYLSTNALSMPVKLDSLNNTLAEIEKTVSFNRKPRSLRIEALQKKKQSLQYALETIKSDNKIKVRVSERSSFEYPEEISLAHYFQNAINFNFSMNLWDGNKTKNLYLQKQKELNSTDEQQKNFDTEINRDYTKACNTLSFLKSEQKIAEQGVEEMEKFAKLVYGSYQAGQVGYLDVENANLKVLEWKVQLATIKAKIATQLAILGFYLS